MIQRIQSIYLFFVFCFMLILVFVPFYASWVISSSAGIVAALSAIAIFLYKNRPLQIKICYVMLPLLVLPYALYFYFERSFFPPAEQLFACCGFTFVFPLISFALVCLTIKGIKKDEQLVRSLDRLR